MKNLLLTLFIFISLNTFAQINFGVQVGYCRVGGYEGYKYKSSGMGGVFVRYTKKSTFASVEVNYIGRGAIKSIPYTNNTNTRIEDGSQKVVTKYLQVPIFVGGLIKTSKCNFYIKGGVFYAFGLDGKITNTPPYNSGLKTTTTGINGFNNDFGLLAAGGIELKSLLFFETRIEKGLNSVNNNSNVALTFLVGLRFGKDQ